MPYWFETMKLRVGKERDKRRKLNQRGRLAGEKEEIKKLWLETIIEFLLIQNEIYDEKRKQND